MDEIERRLLQVEIQLKRMVSDIESEKDSRSRRNKDFEMRLRNVERAIYAGFGAVALLQVVLKYVL